MNEITKKAVALCAGVVIVGTTTILNMMVAETLKDACKIIMKK